MLQTWDPPTFQILEPQSLQSHNRIIRANPGQLDTMWDLQEYLIKNKMLSSMLRKYLFLFITLLHISIITLELLI